jgi:mRNA interferase MazF
MRKDRDYHRGDVFLAYLGDPFGSEQGGLRPVIIMQNDLGCVYSPTVTMVPLTSNLKKVHLPSHYVLRDAPFLKKESMALGEQIDTIDKRRLHTFLGRLSTRDMECIAEAVKEHLGFYISENIEAP